MQWISVKDIMPTSTKECPYLLIDSNNNIDIGYFHIFKNKEKGEFTSCGCCNSLDINDVTHWALLPNPPQ